jgi:hypothetical protein
MRDRTVFLENAIRRILCKLLPLSAAYDAGSWTLVTAFSGMRMTPADDYPRMADEPMFRHDASFDGSVRGFELDALQSAKERQDRVHAALDVWIAAAIAELAAGR